MKRKQQIKTELRKKKKLKTAKNPFDLQQNNSRQKHVVLGRRVRGGNRNVAKARADAEEKRQKTLLSDFKIRHKENKFKDRRIGEDDASLTLEEKMLIRFQEERKKKLNRSQKGLKFQLNQNSDQEDEEEEFLTHKGSKIDDYDSLNQQEDQDNDEDGVYDKQVAQKQAELDREIVNRLHFGGGAASASGDKKEGDKKTHKEIMQEVMMKSKLFKAEKQKTKMAQEDLTEDLDKGFGDIQSLLSFRPKKGQEPQEKKAELDDFDLMAKEFAFEAKAKATERRKTPEEIALSEKEKLLEYEKKRIARMNGEDDVEEDDDDNDRHLSTRQKKKAQEKKEKKRLDELKIKNKSFTDDDLVDDYEVNPAFQVNNVSDEDNEGDNKMDIDKKVDVDSGDDSDVGEEEEDNVSDNDNEGNANVKQSGEQEMPFIFDFPETLSDLQSLFSKYGDSVEKRCLIINRILILFSPKLNPENEKKMTSFFSILIKYFVKLAASNYIENKSELDAIGALFYDMSKDLNQIGGSIFRERIVKIQTRVSKKLSWPTLSECFLFRLAINIYPASDLRHNIVSPIELLLGQCLSESSVNNMNDALCALFCCSLSLMITQEKNRFTPEVLDFLSKFVRSFSSNVEYAELNFLRKGIFEWIKNPTSALAKIDFGVYYSSESPGDLNSAFVISVVTTGFELVRRVVQQYSEIPSFAEAVESLGVSLLCFKEFFSATIKNYPCKGKVVKRNLKAMKDLIDSVESELKTNMEKCLSKRRPLRLQNSGPLILESFAPKFETNYTIRKDKNLARDAAKMKQLTRQVKRERKGAARELKKDAAFLAKAKQSEVSEILAEKKEKQAKIQAWVQDQAATFNQQVKKGGSLLKGGGSAHKPQPRIKKKR